jgi:pyridoxamine 5'-phosphate oxidase family protein
MTLLTPYERDYLATQPLGRLATVTTEGRPQNNPVGFSYDEKNGVIDIGGWTMAKTRKFANVIATQVAALVVDDLVSREPWTVRGIELRGRAEAIYGQEPANARSSPDIIRLYPSRVISWGLDPEHPGMQGRSVGPPEPLSH